MTAPTTKRRASLHDLLEARDREILAMNTSAEQTVRFLNLLADALDAGKSPSEAAAAARRFAAEIQQALPGSRTPEGTH